MVQLTDDLVDELDVVARRRGISRSALIRSVIAEFLADDRAAAIGTQIAEGYRRAPQLVPDAWGVAETLAERSTTELMQRLDAEERAGGHAPW
jgi:hypothetical protein